MEHFCTCDNADCKLHPKNHDKGCTLCMQKNLKKGEIPTCIFKMINPDITNVEKFDINGFLKHAKNTDL